MYGVADNGMYLTNNASHVFTVDKLAHYTAGNTYTTGTINICAAYNIKVDPSYFDGSVKNFYDIYLPTNSFNIVQNRYGIYQEDPDATNVFYGVTKFLNANGNVLTVNTSSGRTFIGDADPVLSDVSPGNTSKLSVGGDVWVNGSTRCEVSGAGNATVATINETTTCAVTVNGTIGEIGCFSSHPLYIYGNGGAQITLNSTGTSVSAAFKTESAVSRNVTEIVTTGGTTVIGSTEHIIILTGSSTHTLTLPTKTNGRELIIVTKSTGDITINRAGSDTIDGATSKTLQYAGKTNLKLIGGTTANIWYETF
jgi:hypothetical protein